MNYELRIVFFGTGNYVLPILEVLKSDFELVLVLTTEKNDIEPVSKFCKKNGIKCISVSKFDHNTKYLIQNTAATAGVLANFGLIIPQEVLDIFPKGIINIHPSLLPKYRGPTPGQTAILNGDTKTGVTIIKLDKEVDHGPILVQEKVEILPNDTASTLYERLFKIGSQMLAKSLPMYLCGELKPTEQDHSKANFTKTLTRDSGFIDLNNQQSIINNQLHHMIRAYSLWPGVWLVCNSEKGEESSLNNKIIKLLPDNKVQVEGGKPMSYKDFLNGYPEGKEILQKLNLY